MLPARRIAGFAGTAEDTKASSTLGRSKSMGSKAPFPSADCDPQALPLAMAEAAFFQVLSSKGRTCTSGPERSGNDSQPRYLGRSWAILGPWVLDSRGQRGRFRST
eukprot:8054164-Pyramimonas_sp.AAC.1